MKPPTDALALAFVTSFGRSLRFDRRAVERSQGSIAAQAALTKKIVVELESGKAPDARISTLTRLALALGNDPIEMMQRFRPGPAAPE